MAPERATRWDFRDRLARGGVPAIRALDRQPRWLVVGALVLLILGGLFAPRWPGTACLVVVALLLGWLVVALGSAGGTGRTVARLLTLGLLLVLVVMRASGAGPGA